jgi:type VI protein secretion system component Hcp
VNFYLRITGSKQGKFKGNSTKPNRIGWMEILECAPETLAALGLSGGDGGGRSMKFSVEKDGALSSPTLFQSLHAAGFGAGIAVGLGSQGSAGNGGGSVSKGGSGGGSGSGSKGGKPPFVITKVSDLASPQLLRACLTGESLPEFLFDVSHSSGSGFEGVTRRFSLLGARIVDVRTRLGQASGPGTLAHDIVVQHQGCQQVSIS